MATRKRIQQDSIDANLTAPIGKSILEKLAPSLHRRGVPTTNYIVVNTATGDFVTGKTREEARERFRGMHPGAKGWMQRFGDVSVASPVLAGSAQHARPAQPRTAMTSFTGKTGWRAQAPKPPQPLLPVADLRLSETPEIDAAKVGTGEIPMPPSDGAVVREREAPVTKKLKDELISLIPNLRAFAVSLCGQRDRADDLVQETLLKAWSHLDSYQDGTNLRAWLFTILRNSFFSEMRKRRREVEDAGGKKAEILSIAPAQQGHVDMLDLRKALDLLPPYQREALVMVGAAGMSYEEAAAIAKCAVGTIKSRVNRARSRLAELLGVDGPQAFGPDFAIGSITGRVIGR